MHRTVIAVALALASASNTHAGALPSVVTLVDGGITLEFSLEQPVQAREAGPSGTTTCGGGLPVSAAGHSIRGVPADTFRMTKFCTGTVDHLFEHLFFLRTDTETSETVWPLPDSVVEGGNTATFGWQQFQGRFFDAELSVTVSDTSGGAGTAGTALFTFTATAQPVAPAGASTLHAFPYFDFCLDDACEGMGAELVTPNNEIRVATAAADTEIVIHLLGAASYAVAPYPDVLDRLQDGIADTLGNTGLPFGPGDFTGAFETSFPSPQLPVGLSGTGSTSISWEIGISNATVPVELMQFEVD